MGGIVQGWRERLEEHAARLAVRQGRRATRRGMTLMEVMIVIAIILLLMGALTFGLAGMFQDAQADTARLMITKINQKVQVYKVKKKKLPDSLEELYRGEDMPVDPWGNTFVYRKTGDKGFDIISLGADGKEGGTGADADVKLSEMSE